MVSYALLLMISILQALVILFITCCDAPFIFRFIAQQLYRSLPSHSEGALTSSYRSLLNNPPRSFKFVHLLIRSATAEGDESYSSGSLKLAIRKN
jgi:hypothetical protein